jgi:hypothetical protein
MSFSITHRGGEMERDPDLSALEALVKELDRDDAEHPDIAVSHESGWTISAFPSGRVVYENVEDPSHQPPELTTSRRDLAAILRHVAAGDHEALASLRWRLAPRSITRMRRAARVWRLTPG